MKIKLTQNKYCIVDKHEFDSLNKYKWYYNNGYALRRDGKKSLFLHRYLLKAKKGQIVDHINGNRLDNRLCNLRFVTMKQNNQNRSYQKRNKTKVRGLTYRPKIKKYEVNIFSNSCAYYLGLYKDKYLAMLIYSIVALELFGNYTRFNGEELI